MLTYDVDGSKSIDDIKKFVSNRVLIEYTFLIALFKEEVLSDNLTIKNM